MEKTDATTMVNVIKDIILSFGLDKAKLRGNAMMVATQWWGREEEGSNDPY